MSARWSRIYVVGLNPTYQFFDIDRRGKLIGQFARRPPRNTTAMIECLLAQEQTSNTSKIETTFLHSCHEEQRLSKEIMQPPFKAQSETNAQTECNSADFELEFDPDRLADEDWLTFPVPIPQVWFD
jgi:hypothetical protein